MRLSGRSSLIGSLRSSANASTIRKRHHPVRDGRLSLEAIRPGDKGAVDASSHPWQGRQGDAEIRPSGSPHGRRADLHGPRPVLVCERYGDGARASLGRGFWSENLVRPPPSREGPLPSNTAVAPPPPRKRCRHRPWAISITVDRFEAWVSSEGAGRVGNIELLVCDRRPSACLELGPQLPGRALGGPD